MSQVLRPYPEYRPSGLPWLGAVPAHWATQRAKYLFREVDERSVTGTEELLSVSHLTGVTPRRQKNVTMFMAESYVGHKCCLPGDLVINTKWAWMGALGVARDAGLVSPSYHVYRPSRSTVLLPGYADLLLRTPQYVSEYVCRSTGIRASRLRLYPEQFLDIPLVLPTVEEQGTTLTCLNAKNRYIRHYIRNKRRLITLLNEQKQAIIDRAVTRGIPEHWHTRRLKHLVRNVNEQTNAKNPEEIYLALEDIESWTGEIIKPETDVSFESQVKRFQPGDILFGKLRPYLAKVCRPEQAGVCVGELLVLRPNANGVLPRFLERKLRSRGIIDLINSSTYGAKMPRAEWAFIGDVMISYPPSDDEQRSILSFLDGETEAINEAMTRTQREIDLVREYRTRLIADVVTGKLDVRHVARDGMGAENGHGWMEEVEAALADGEAEEVESLDVAEEVDGDDG